MNQQENQSGDRTLSGSNLVLGIFALAIGAALLSWVYRYQATHDSQQFWGPNFSRLIAQPSRIRGFELYRQSTPSADKEFQILDKTFYQGPPRDLSTERGMIHLRNSILTDSNYDWTRAVDTDDWKWCLQFAEDDVIATILFNEDFSVLGRLNRRADNLRQVDCSPMADKVRAYFTSTGIFSVAESDPASKASE